jgi:hypothetical protein
MATFARMAGSQREEARPFSPPLSSPARLHVKSTEAKPARQSIKPPRPDPSRRANIRRLGRSRAFGYR